MAERNKMLIYLIKDKYLNREDKVIDSSSCVQSLIEGIGTVYYETSKASIPTWADSFFLGKIDKKKLFSANARAVLLCRITTESGKEALFAIAMGYGKNMLAEDVVVDDFGIKVVLNTITPSSLRRINKTNIGGNLKTSNEQLPQEAGIDEFGFDIERDLISAITGRAEDNDFFSGTVTGGEMLSITSKTDISNIKDLLIQLYRRYDSNKYKEEFGWIDQIKRVRSKELLDGLNEQLVDYLIKNPVTLSMTVPDPIEWENVRGFRIGNGDIYNDVELSMLMNSFRKEIHKVEQLKNKRLLVVGSNDDIIASFNAFKCISGEIQFNEKTYCISNGKWYCIDVDFLNEINNDYENIPISTVQFIPYRSSFKCEADYSSGLVESDPHHMLLMDRKVISHGEGKSKIELCDVLINDGTFIHIKPYTGSSTLSHLFNQAVVSSELIRGDAAFRVKANDLISSITDDDSYLIKENLRPNVVLAILSNKETTRPQIPLFSKIALRHAYRRLKTMGCQMSIRNINKNELDLST